MNSMVHKRRPIVFLLLLIPVMAVIAENRTLHLESKILESFEDDPDTGEELLSRWVVIPSRFVKMYLDKRDNQEKPDITVKKVNAWPEALYGKNLENLPLYCLGLHTSFTRKGYNYVDIMPARQFDPAVDLREYVEGKDDPKDIVPSASKCNKDYVIDRDRVIFVDKDGKEWVSDPIVFEGRARGFSVWVWGSNYNYYMEAHFEDYRGIVHVIHLGDLNYNGWKNLTVDIPSAIPQSERYIPRTRRLKLVKLRMWTRPTERVSGFFLYIDQMKIITDLYETRYDGDELENPETLQEIWGECYY
ncbi:MAG: hypothetical protein JW881_12780 [Spirochaetales bacterium]|nr:hypothetical protein [Spirochaetales bacterium]